MDLRDCEVITLAPRGHAAAVLIGPRRISGDELAALLQQYSAEAAPGTLLPLPAYWSPDGWQDASAIYTADEGALSRRLVVFSNAEEVARRWLDDSVLLSLEEAAANWWTDTLVMVVTVNRGMLTLRMSGDGLQPLQLNLVGELFRVMATGLKSVAMGR